LAHNDIRQSTELVDNFLSYSKGGSTRRKVDPGVSIWNPIWEKRAVVGVSDCTVRKSGGGFLQAVHCDYCVIFYYSAAIFHRISLTLKSTGSGSLSDKIWGWRCWSMYAKLSARDTGLSHTKEIVSISSAVWAQ